MTAAHGVAPQGLHDADDAISVVSNALLAVALGQVLSVPSQPAACQSTSVSRW